MAYNNASATCATSGERFETNGKKNPPSVQKLESNAELNDQLFTTEKACLELVAVTKDRTGKAIELWSIEPRTGAMWVASTIAPHTKMRSAAAADLMVHDLEEAQLSIDSLSMVSVNRISRNALKKVAELLAKEVTDDTFGDISVGELLVKGEIKKLLGIAFENKER